jgi:ParB family chromosome partitioning protein
MSFKKRLEEKSAGLGANLGTDSGQPPRAPRTAPGQMLAFRSQMIEAASKTSELEDRLKAFEGANPARLLDATRVVPSRWANRHLRNFEGPVFDALKAEVLSAGGNVQPIKVRPLKGRPDADYEIVFGHRRHRACLELGLPVLAVVTSIDDAGLFVEMDRENRQRKDLSAWEQGVMYRRALDEGLFVSLRQLAERLGVDAGNVSKAVSLARLPEEIVAAFESPLDLQFRWASSLSEILQRDPEGVVERARALAGTAPRLPARQVLDRLLGQAPVRVAPAEREVAVGGRAVARISRRGRRYVVAFEPGVLGEDAGDKLEALVRAALK